ncbi:MAG TPA: UDP-3-O-acyl-N-acetylglucosamine deacetylase [Gemmatimonadales bacterium]|nr:UDP-3-O-acyl-N-acetylglucosamine deacetylase [Gemmatimonadales bacterium]
MNGRQSVTRVVTVQGTGLHSGRPVTLRFVPAESGAGIAFRRTDLPGSRAIPALARAVRSTDRRTELAAGEAGVQTTEHVLAAVVAAGLDDLLIELDGPEPPAGDGSAAEFVEALRTAGTTSLSGSPQVVTVQHAFRVQEGESEYLIGPGDGLRLTVTIAWPHPLIGTQSGCYEITGESFARELARARTFGFESEKPELMAKGLAQGASGAAIRLSDAGVVGTELRWPDEFVRHKTVDLLGDLALLGSRLRATIVAFRPGHAGNLSLVRALQGLSAGAPTVMGIETILQALPHRYPMLLVDRIVELQGRDKIVGIKNVTFNEPFFQGHFPGHPVMPGVLIVEAMAQVGGVLLMNAVEDATNKAVYFMSIDNVKFRRPVVPGDQLRFELEMLQFRGKVCRMRGVGYVDGQVAAEAEMLAGIVDR